MPSVAGIEVEFGRANTDFSKRWLDFGPSTTVLPRGWTKAEGRRALPEDLVFHRDVAVPLRDGSTMYMDVFRAQRIAEPIPAIIAWSPYGKQGNGMYAGHHVF